MKDEIIIYQSSEPSTKLEVKIGNDTVWLTIEQISLLFGRDRTVINRHINNIFKEGELDRELVCAFFALTTQHGAIKGKIQIKEVLHFNLDVIISVGYRVKSKQGTLFRIWANKVLKDYLLKGYAINNRMEKLEDDIIVTQRNSTTANTYSFIIDYKGFKGILILGGGSGRNGYTVGQKGPYFSVVDINKLNNWDSPEEILRKVKNVPLIYKPLDTSEVYMNYETGKRYRMGDTITWLPNRPFNPNVSHYIKEWQTETSYEVIYKKSNK